ncbi:hypothetical protein SpCBS45565_g07900 [Spizellomyces sp. 'palustris']|nr:hypothetical protein SpCBS45565_g07900 [Spizellomyces sp. 'palustris']
MLIPIPQTDRQLFLAASYVLDMFVFYEYATTWKRPPPPMRRPHTEKSALSKWMLWIHILGGFSELYGGLFALLLPRHWRSTYYLTQLTFLSAAIIQVPTSLFFVPSVAGVKTLMHPGYICVSAMHMYVAVSGLWQMYTGTAFPADQLEATVAILHTYAWVRMFYWLLKYLVGDERKLLTTVIYTFSVTMAGLLTVSHVFGPKGNVLLVSGWVLWGAIGTKWLGVYRREMDGMTGSTGRLVRAQSRRGSRRVSTLHISFPGPTRRLRSKTSSMRHSPIDVVAPELPLPSPTASPTGIDSAVDVRPTKPFEEIPPS